ncbi:Sin3 family co-repressor-domain-containing protein [Fennellomyces sp. T-0311]|nr:Sin3 family co-repressor-domain-containing protein [Fennellomyces sp. T-0311]
MSNQNQTNRPTCLYSLLPPSMALTLVDLQAINRICLERIAFDRATVYTTTSADAISSFYTRVTNCLGADATQNRLQPVVEAFRMQKISATELLLLAASLLTEYDNLLRCLVVILPQDYRIDIYDDRGYKIVHVSGPVDVKLTLYGPLTIPARLPSAQMPTPPEASGYATSPTSTHILSPVKDNSILPPLDVGQSYSKAAIPDSNIPIDRANSYHGDRVNRSTSAHGGRAMRSRSARGSFSGVDNNSAKNKISLPPLENMKKSNAQATPRITLPRILPAPAPPRNIPHTSSDSSDPTSHHQLPSTESSNSSTSTVYTPASSSSPAYAQQQPILYIPNYPLAQSAFQRVDQSSPTFPPHLYTVFRSVQLPKGPSSDIPSTSPSQDVSLSKQTDSENGEQRRIPYELPPNRPSGPSHTKSGRKSHKKSLIENNENSVSLQNDAPPQIDPSSQAAHPPTVTSTTAQEIAIPKDSPMPTSFISMSTPVSLENPQLAPRRSPIVKQNDVAMFAQVQKHLSSTAYNDFLKLLNMFTEEILDVESLVAIFEHMFQDRRDILGWLKSVTGHIDEPQIPHLADSPLKKPDLALCARVKASPSYRRVTDIAWINQPCSARDDLCREVLNDVYVSYPTEESEDSNADTFKSNKYEEALHRIEEKRYEFDSNIDDNEKAITRLLHIRQEERLDSLSDDQKKEFNQRVDVKKFIFVKAIKAAYGKKFAPKVLDAFFKYPAQNIPTVLSFLENEGAKWRKARRELQEIWRKMEEENYALSLEYKPKRKRTKRNI